MGRTAENNCSLPYPNIPLVRCCRSFHRHSHSFHCSWPWPAARPELYSVVRLRRSSPPGAATVATPISDALLARVRRAAPRPDVALAAGGKMVAVAASAAHLRRTQRQAKVLADPLSMGYGGWWSCSACSRWPRFRRRSRSRSRRCEHNAN